jgi:hypothetical protein
VNFVFLNYDIVNDGLKVGGWKSGLNTVNRLIKKEKMGKD